MKLASRPSRRVEVKVKRIYGDESIDIVSGKEMTFSPGMTMYNFPSKTLKRTFKEIVFTNDPHSLFIVENTFSVLGSTFSKRKIY